MNNKVRMLRKDNSKTLSNKALSQLLELEKEEPNPYEHNYKTTNSKIAKLAEEAKKLNQNLNQVVNPINVFYANKQESRFKSQDAFNYFERDLKPINVLRVETNVPQMEEFS